MSNNPTDRKFPRRWDQSRTLILGAWAAIVLYVTASSWTDGFTCWDPPSMVNGSLVIESILIAVVLAVLLWLVLPGLETIHITQEEVRCQLGPIILWRRSFADIQTVIRTGSPVSDGPAPPKNIPCTEKKFRHLVFSTVEAEELRRRCRNAKAKHLDRDGRFRMEHQKQATNEEVKRWHERRLFAIRCRMEWTEEAEEILRQRLTMTTFIL